MCGSVFRHPKATMCQNHGRAEGSSEHKGKIKIISSNKSGILVIYDFRVKIAPYLVSTSIFGTKLKFGAKLKQKSHSIHGTGRFAPTHLPFLNHSIHGNLQRSDPRSTDPEKTWVSDSSEKQLTERGTVGKPIQCLMDSRASTSFRYPFWPRNLQPSFVFLWPLFGRWRMWRARQFRQLGSLDVVWSSLGKVGDCPPIIWGHEMGPMLVGSNLMLKSLVLLRDSPL